MNGYNLQMFGHEFEKKKTIIKIDSKVKGLK